MNPRRRMMFEAKKPLWIYKSGDKEFSNVTYNLTSGSEYADFENNYVRIRYHSSDNSPSSVTRITFAVTKTFKGYKKLCFEAKQEKAYGNNSYIGIYDRQETRKNLTTSNTFYEIDLADYQNENRFEIFQYEENATYIYNMWLE